MPFSLGECKAADMYAEQFEDTLRHSIPKGKLAAFFCEPIQVDYRSLPSLHIVVMVIAIANVAGCWWCRSIPQGILEEGLRNSKGEWRVMRS